MKDLKGKVAVLTGGANGIGKAIAERFAKEGMRLVLADLNQKALEQTVDELRQKQVDVIGVRTDVSKLAAVEALRDATLARFGAVHVLCNNAGISSGAHGRLWEHELNDWAFAMSVHVYGVINGINAFVPSMLAQGDECHIVNTSSHNGGFAPIAMSPTYATCKAACVTISECLWGQLHAIGSKIGVSVLFPSGKTQGILDTGIWKAAERPPEFPSEAPVDMTSKLDDWVKAMEAAGKPVVFTPLSEVAETVVDGLYANRFWMVEEGRFEDMLKQRTDIILRRAAPDYQRP